MAKLFLDNDRLVISGDGYHEFAVTEDALAAILLVSLGYGVDDLPHRLADAETALQTLRDADVNLALSPNPTAKGFHFLPHVTPSHQRMLSGRLAQRAAQQPEALALILDMGPDTGAYEISAEDLHALVSDVAARFAGEGIVAGDHIAVSSNPTLESIVLLHAAWEVGISAVLVRDSASDALMEVIDQHVGPKLWFLPEGKKVPAGGKVVRLTGAASGGFDDWLDAGPMGEPVCKVNPETEAVVVPSSGSTGEPKLLALSHRGLFHSTHLALSSAPEPVDGGAHRHSSSTDLTAIAGLRSLAALPLVSHHAAVILADGIRESSLGILEAFGRLKVTHAQVIPGSLRAAIEMGDSRLGALHLKNLVLVASGTGVLHGAIRDETARIFGCVLRDNYGMNECTGAFAWNDEATVSTAGAPSFNTLVRIVRTDGTPCEIGETGHVRIFSEGLFSGQYTSAGYIERPRGWFTAGDLGVRQPDGSFAIVGRSHDLIKSQEGEFISPIAIESAALRVASVQDAVVVKLPASQRGERFALAVEAAQNDNNWLTMALSQAINASVGPFAVPDKISVLASLPRAANGKPDRARLASMLAENG